MPARYFHQCLRCHDSFSHFQSPLQRGKYIGNMLGILWVWWEIFICPPCLISVNAQGPPNRGFPAMLARGSGRSCPQASFDGKIPAKAAWNQIIVLWHMLSCCHFFLICIIPKCPSQKTLLREKAEETFSDHAMTRHTGSKEIVPTFSLKNNPPNLSHQ